MVPARAAELNYSQADFRQGFSMILLIDSRKKAWDPKSLT
jgi:hypothetical protein